MNVEGPRCIYNSSDEDLGAEITILAKSDPELLVREALNMLLNTLRGKFSSLSPCRVNYPLELKEGEIPT